jgi:hypothetical protein
VEEEVEEVVCSSKCKDIIPPRSGDKVVICVYEEVEEVEEIEEEETRDELPPACREDVYAGSCSRA